MITTRHNITVERREHWQPCGVCGDNTPFYAHFVAPDGLKSVWPICCIECYEGIAEKWHEMKEDARQCMNWGIA